MPFGCLEKAFGKGPLCQMISANLQVVTEDWGKTLHQLEGRKGSFKKEPGGEHRVASCWGRISGNTWEGVDMHVLPAFLSVSEATYCLCTICCIIKPVHFTVKWGKDYEEKERKWLCSGGCWAQWWRCRLGCLRCVPRCLGSSPSSTGFWPPANVYHGRQQGMPPVFGLLTPMWEIWLSFGLLASA